MRHKRLSLAAVLLAAILPAAAQAAPRCEIPGDLAPAPRLTPPLGEIQAGVVNAYYLLAISWSPEWCRTNGEGDTSQRLQCEGPARGFVLHGLWPNGVAKPYPRYCRPVGRLDLATVRGMFCRTPSPELLQHEWQAHGACGWPDARAYFQQEAALYDRVVMPSIEAIPRAELSAGAVRRAFVEKNPWLKSRNIWIGVDKGRRLKEVRLCYDLRFRPMTCMGGVGTPDVVRVRLTPSRSGAF
jgi:ribonuclease T2